MKSTTLIAAVLITALTLSGCGIYTSTALSGVPKSSDISQPGGAGTGMDATIPEVVAPAPVEPAAVVPAPEKPAASAASARLTRAEAESIALKHAGFDAGQVNGLRSEYDFDDGAAHYDVEFRVGQWEYEYEIHAETGAVLSFEKDD